LISTLTWLQLTGTARRFLCSQYGVCSIKDFRTLAAVPDLVKHRAEMLKYFSLHFYNNQRDHPPEFCKPPSRVWSDGRDNLLVAVSELLLKFNSTRLTFKELSFLVHLLMDLHQPFHCTAAMRGGMQIVLRDASDKTSFSLHALWDAEMIRLILQKEKTRLKLLEGFQSHRDAIRVKLDSGYVLEWLQWTNAELCRSIWTDGSMSIEAYTSVQEDMVIYLVLQAARVTSGVINGQSLAQ
jgi:hypothetical protein